jgi:glucuronate isomerase
MAGTALEVHPDRLLPADPGTRAIARTLYDRVRQLPLISPHGHVDPAVLLDNRPFPDPTALLLTPDHYVTRLLHADGVELAALGVGQGELSQNASRQAWRLLCERWHVYQGTPVSYWLEAELAEIFGVTVAPSASTADTIYDQIGAALADDAFLPRALFERFGISVLATTDDPCSDLTAHATLVDDPAWNGRVVPTFRPDRYLEAGQDGWAGAVSALGTRPHASTGRRWPARQEPRRPSRSAGTCCWRWRGCRARTAWS